MWHWVDIFEQLQRPLSWPSVTQDRLGRYGIKYARAFYRFFGLVNVVGTGADEMDKEVLTV